MIITPKRKRNDKEIMKKSLFLNVLHIVYSHVLFERYHRFDIRRRFILHTHIRKRIRCLQYINLHDDCFKTFAQINQSDIQHHEFYYKSCQLCKKHLQIICHQDNMIYFMCLHCEIKTFNMLS